jgi:hypothetical protein
VARLDAVGGDVTVGPTACYAGVKHWLRRVTWTAKALTVADDVALADGQLNTVLFRWHLGTARPVVIEGGEKAFTVRWADATLTLEGSEPLLVTQEMLPDLTLDTESRQKQGEDYLHTCLVVRTRDAVGALRLTTQVAPS